MSIHTFNDASDYLGTKDDRPLDGRATRLRRRDDGSIAVRYQATDVVTYHPGGRRIVLDSGGWRTPTTKDRICTYTRARVYAARGIWYIADGALFEDGMGIREDGTPIKPKREGAADLKRKRTLDQHVRRYIKGFAELVERGELPEPNNGDCWGCLMQVQGAPEVKQGPFRREMPTPHGRVEPMGVDHYLSHLGIGPEADEELYYVPSLLWNAIKARGYRDPAVIGWMIWRNRDHRLAADVLRSYFRKLKPALLAELQRQGGRS